MLPTSRRSPSAPLRTRRRPFVVDLRTPQGNFALAAGQWSSLTLTQQSGFHALSLKMAQDGLFPSGPRQSGYTLFMQMNRAARSINSAHRWTAVPAVPALPPSPPQFTLSATSDGAHTQVYLHAAAYGVGCQVWVSRVFVPGCREPFAQRTTLAGALPAGWPDGGVDLSAVLALGFRAAAGMAFVVKIVPVTADGFVGPPLSEMCVVQGALPL